MESLDRIREELDRARMSPGKENQMVRLPAGWIVEAAGGVNEPDEIVSALLQGCKPFDYSKRLLINQCDCEHLLDVLGKDRPKKDQPS